MTWGAWSRFQPFERRVERTLRKLAPGDQRGTLESATRPISPTHELRTYEPAAATGRGDGRPYATFVIAASDSTAEDKANADYVCDGTADQVQINAAIDALPNSAGSGQDGGKVLLLEGTYNVSAPIKGSLSLHNGIHLQGMGYGTQIKPAASFDSSSSTSVIYLGNANNHAVTDLAVLGFNNEDGLDGVTIRSSFGRIERVYVEDIGIGIVTFGGACFVVGNAVWDCLQGIYADGGPDSPFTATDDYYLIAHNQVAAATDGIYVRNIEDSIIASNLVRGGSLTRGIKLDGNSDRNLVTANIIRAITGVRVEVSTCNDNLIVGNDLRLATTPISDAGTGTLKTWPNHATYGDNFT